MADHPALSIPQALRRGGNTAEERAYIDEGRDILSLVADVLGIAHLGHCRVLDVGCGTKFTQAILEYDIPIAEYVGVDVFEPMIERLQAEVTDPRFSYLHMNTHNAMYNPEGDKLTANSKLPLPEKYFDVITLFSVFTHMEPDDYHHMLKMLRPHVAAGGAIVFSLYLEELTGNGFGLYEQLAGDNRDAWKPSGLDFHDAHPTRPLHWAIYSRKHALELIQGTGWQPEAVYLPRDFVQHHIKCTPC